MTTRSDDTFETRVLVSLAEIKSGLSGLSEKYVDSRSRIDAHARELADLRAAHGEEISKLKANQARMLGVAGGLSVFVPVLLKVVSP